MSDERRDRDLERKAKKKAEYRQRKESGQAIYQVLCLNEDRWVTYFIDEGHLDPDNINSKAIAKAIAEVIDRLVCDEERIGAEPYYWGHHWKRRAIGLMDREDNASVTGNELAAKPRKLPDGTPSAWRNDPRIEAVDYAAEDDFAAKPQELPDCAEEPLDGEHFDQDWNESDAAEGLGSINKRTPGGYFD